MRVPFYMAIYAADNTLGIAAGPAGHSLMEAAANASGDLMSGQVHTALKVALLRLLLGAVARSVIITCVSLYGVQWDVAGCYGLGATSRWS